MRVSRPVCLWLLATSLALPSLACSPVAEAGHPIGAHCAAAATTHPSGLLLELDRGLAERGQAVGVYLVNRSSTPWAQPWFEPDTRCLRVSVRPIAGGGAVYEDPPCDPRLTSASARALAPGDKLLVGTIEPHDLRLASAGAYSVETQVGEAILQADLELTDPPEHTGEVNLVTGVLELMDLSLELQKTASK